MKDATPRPDLPKSHQPMTRAIWYETSIEAVVIGIAIIFASLALTLCVLKTRK